MKQLILLLLTIYATAIMSCAAPTTNGSGFLHLPMPGPLFTFGQNILPKGSFLNTNFFYYSDGPERSELLINPRFLWGVADNASFMFIPASAVFKQGKTQVQGLRDFVFQLEVAPYHIRTFDSVTRITGIVAFFAPMGQIEIGGRKKPSYFLGWTAGHMSTEWYAYTSWGMHFATRDGDLRIGHKFFYEMGAGKILFHNDCFHTKLMLNLNGIYEDRDSFMGRRLDQTGGNAIFVGPALTIEVKNFALDIGGQYPITERVFQKQRLFDFLFGAGLSWWIMF